MADLRDIYAHVRALQDEVYDWIDLHTNESGGRCRCEHCAVLECLNDRIDDLLRLMEPDMIGQSTAIAATYVVRG